MKKGKIILTVAIGFILVMAAVSMVIVPKSRADDNIVSAAGLIDYQGEDGGGTGTAEDPFLIGSFDTLHSRLEENADKFDMHFVLINNIDSNGKTWNPINLLNAGSVLDGNGFTIDELKIQIRQGGSNRPGSTAATAGENTTYGGMFIDLLGTVKNLTIEKASVVNTNLPTAYGTGVVGLIACLIEGNTGNINFDGRTVTPTIENVKINSGTVELPAGTSTNSTYGVLGGLVGEIMLYSGSPVAPSNVYIKNSYCKADLNAADNNVGGIVAVVMQNESSGYSNINIENSYYQGNLTVGKLRSGGIIAAATTGINLTVNITNCYAHGQITYHNNVVGANGVGGIIGFINNSSPYISKYNIANCYTAFTYSIADQSQDVSTALGAIVGYHHQVPVNFISVTNSYYDNNQFNPYAYNPQSVSVYGTTNSPVPTKDGIFGNDSPYDNPAAVNSSGLDTATMTSMTVIGYLGNALFMENPEPNNYPVLSCFYNSTLTFDPNGGIFASGVDTSKPIQVTVPNSNSIQANAVPGVTKVGYTFGGWTSNLNGTVTLPGDLTMFIPTGSATYYAKWAPKEYILAFDSTDGQHYKAVDGSNINITTVTIGQTGYIQAYLSSGSTKFIDFEVKDKNGDWVGLHSGETYNGNDAQPSESRLPLNGLIDENFISNYADSSGTISVKAVYDEADPIHITVTSDGQQYGNITINGVKVPYNTPLSYTGDGISITVKAVANDYCSFGAFTVTLNGLPVDSGATIDGIIIYQLTGANMASIVPVDGLEIKAGFSANLYNIRVAPVLAKNNASVTASGTVADTSTASVGLGSSYSNTIYTAQGYNLTGGIVNNIRLWNNLTGCYDSYSATRGAINFSNIDSVFMDKYLSGGEIVIYADYVAQHILRVTANDYTRGNVVITVISPEGITSKPLVLADTYIDEGSAVKITITANEDSSVSGITGTGSNEVNTDNSTISFMMGDVDRIIGIEFTDALYYVTYKAVDENGKPIDDLVEVINAGSDVITALDGIELSTMAKDGSGVNPADYKFVRWYIVDNDGNEISSDIPTDTTTNEILIDFDLALVSGRNINFVAEFTRSYSLKIIIANGTYYVKSGGSTGPTKTPADKITTNTYDGNTELEITIMPYAYYTMGEGSIDGQYTNKKPNADGSFTVTVTVDGDMAISFNCTPIVYSVVTAGSIKGGQIVVNTEKVSLNDNIIISFRPSAGNQLDKWTLNGIDLSKYGKISGNTMTIKADAAFLSEINALSAGEIDLNNTVTTVMNSTYMLGLIVLAVAVPVLLIIIVLVYLANRKRKEAYVAAVQKQRESSSMLNTADYINKLRSGEDTTQGGK